MDKCVGSVYCNFWRESGVDRRNVIRELKRDGWFEVNQAGSHKQFKHPKKKGRVPVPHPKRDIPMGNPEEHRKTSRGETKLTQCGNGYRGHEVHRISA